MCIQYIHVTVCVVAAISFIKTVTMQEKTEGYRNVSL